MAKREELVLVRSKVKAYAKKVKRDFRFPDDAVVALDKKVKALIQDIVKAAAAYGKKTVKAKAI